MGYGISTTSLEDLAAQGDAKIKAINEKGCLSNDTIYKLYEGGLSKNKFNDAISHLAECGTCLVDFQFYSQMMNS